MIHIEENWKKIREELAAIKRPGIEALIDYLENKTDFKTAPASTKFHLSNLTGGGLAEHSLNVLRFGREVLKLVPCEDITDESVTIACLMHDLCKVNYYVRGWEWDKEWKEKTREWRKKDVWKVEDQVPLGHGEKSVILLIRHIALTTDEMCAIRWHMLTSEPGVNFNYPTGFPFRESQNKYPLLKTVAIADQLAEMYESLNYKEEVIVPQDLPF